MGRESAMLLPVSYTVHEFNFLKLYLQKTLKISCNRFLLKLTVLT